MIRQAMKITIDIVYCSLYNNIRFAGGLLFAVEKVKPDPLNLTVNTDVGKQSRMVWGYQY